MTNPFDIILNRLEALEQQLQSLPNRIQPAPEPAKAFLSRKDAMDFLGIRTNKLRELTVNGIIPSYKVGSRVMYKRAELVEAMREFAA